MVEICTSYNPQINAITHDGRFHGDEVLATAMLSLLWDKVIMLRTRSQNTIERATNAIVYDVGGEYDDSRNRYDHHQQNFQETRPTGTLYASAGLIWRKYGMEIVRKLAQGKISDDTIIANTVRDIDRNLIERVDARDNGQGDTQEVFSISAAILSFNSLWDSEEDENAQFLQACEMAEMILKRRIENAISTAYGIEFVKRQVDKTEGSVIVMDRFVGSWMQAIANCPKATHLRCGIFPASGNSWNVRFIPPAKGTRSNQRKSFPKAWRGLQGKTLAKVTGVETAIFCHKAGFIATAQTKDDAIRLAHIALGDIAS